MKKLYTIALAAAVGFTATAAPHHAIERTATLSKQSFAIQTANGEKLVKLTNSSDTHKAPTNAPASLDGRNFLFSYGLKNGDSYNSLSSQVEFEFIKSDNESGYDFYNMYGLLDGLFTNITPIEQIVAYSSATGELVLPVAQDIVIFAAQGGNKTLQSWNMIDGSVYSDVDFYFDWNGNGFTWAPSQTFQTQTGNVTYTSTGMYVGTATEDNRVSGVFTIDDFAINPLNGKLTFTMAGDNGAETITSPLSVTVDGNKVNIGNFADMLTMPCTLDTKAKTLTAENVVFGQLNIGSETRPNIVDAYMSEANNADDGYAYNVYDTGVYKIVMHYTTANGKTTVNMPDWNVFYMSGGEDYDAMPFITKSTMTFDFELGAATEGVSDIITDNSNAPVEYFNLQGVRVTNPENGLYIRRQGNKAEKILVK